MTGKRILSLLIMVMILGAAFVPLSDTYAETGNESQSSFEYKNFKDQDEYRNALDLKMHNVYSNINGAIDDKATIPIPGLMNTFTITDGRVDVSSSFVPQGICQADKYILITAYHSKKKLRSVVYAVDTKTNSLVSTLTVPNTYHLGGIAFDGNNIWLTGDTSDKYTGEPFVQYIRYEDFLRMIAEPVYEVGKTYYVWVGVDETTRKSSEVELSCRKMDSETASGLCSIEINGETVIVYTAEANMPLMISSSSDGDPNVVMYDNEGFMLRKDDDSGGVVSGNPKDFALGFNAEKGKTYRICINGEFTKCTVTVQEYKGDGTEPDSGAAAENEEAEDAGE